MQSLTLRKHLVAALERDRNTENRGNAAMSLIERENVTDRENTDRCLNKDVSTQ